MLHCHWFTGSPFFPQDVLLGFCPVTAAVCHGAFSLREIQRGGAVATSFIQTWNSSSPKICH